MRVSNVQSELDSTNNISLDKSEAKLCFHDATGYYVYAGRQDITIAIINRNTD
jgi:hypothetical protein